tara:strand:- start:240 stop:458 length:219 start_codon:yes stop_codon:yes gene_type:complete
MKISEWLEKLADSDTSTEEDWGSMQTYLRMSTMNMPKAVVTYGVVYPEGYGMPLSINKMAEVIMESWKSRVK